MVLGGSDVSLKSCSRRTAVLKCVSVTVGGCFKSVFFGVILRYGGTKTQYTNSHISVICPLESCSWALYSSVLLSLVMREYDMVALVSLLALLLANEIDSGDEDRSGWFCYSRTVRTVYDLWAFKDLRFSVARHFVATKHYWDKKCDDEMVVNLGHSVLKHNCREGINLPKFLSLAKQSRLVALPTLSSRGRTAQSGVQSGK